MLTGWHNESSLHWFRLSKTKDVAYCYHHSSLLTWEFLDRNELHDIMVFQYHVKITILTIKPFSVFHLSISILAFDAHVTPTFQFNKVIALSLDYILKQILDVYLLIWIIVFNKRIYANHEIIACFTCRCNIKLINSSYYAHILMLEKLHYTFNHNKSNNLICLSIDIYGIFKYSLVSCPITLHFT